MLDNDAFCRATDFLGRREWEWSVKDRARAGTLRQGLRLAPAPPDAARAGWSPQAELPNRSRSRPVTRRRSAASREQVLAQQQVDVAGQADVAWSGSRPPARTASARCSTPCWRPGWGSVGTLRLPSPATAGPAGGALIALPSVAERVLGAAPPLVRRLLQGGALSADRPLEVQAKYGECTAPGTRHLYRTGLRLPWRASGPSLGEVTAAADDSATWSGSAPTGPARRGSGSAPPRRWPTRWRSSGPGWARRRRSVACTPRRSGGQCHVS